MFMIYPYKQGSEGAKAVAEALEGKRILRENSTYKPKPGDVIINWGASDCPFPQALNHSVSGSLDKLAFFNRLKNTDLTPKFATNKLQAAAELTFPVFCRTQIKGKDGEGIVVATSWDKLVEAPLYVEGIAKTAEYRLHFGRLPDGTVYYMGGQKKIHKTVEGKHPDVWCGDETTFVWTVNNFPVDIPEDVMYKAEESFKRFPELAFAAFDVVYDGNIAYVLEINSAPMQTPKTTELYAKFFRDYEAMLPKPVAEAPAPTVAPQMSLLDSIKSFLVVSEGQSVDYKAANIVNIIQNKLAA